MVSGRWAVAEQVVSGQWLVAGGQSPNKWSVVSDWWPVDGGQSLWCGYKSAERHLPGLAEPHADAQERRASARRGSVNRTLPGENQARFGDDATDYQERRASARRGTGIAPASASWRTWMLACHGGLTPPAPGWTCVRTSQKSPFHRHTFGLHHERRASARRGNATHLQWRAFFSGRSTFAHHGWLTPAALGCSTCERDCKYAFRADEYAAFPTAGLRQPLLMHGVGRPKNYDIRAVQTHAFHERRASARRGSVNRTLPGENRARFGDDATH